MLAILSAFALWVKTKGLLDYKLKDHGIRIGTAEQAIKMAITSERCSQCQIERERLGKLLVEENKKEHESLHRNLRIITEGQTGLMTAVTTLTANVSTLTTNVDNLFKLWNSHVTRKKDQG